MGPNVAVRLKRSLRCCHPERVDHAAGESQVDAQDFFMYTIAGVVTFFYKDPCGAFSEVADHVVNTCYPCRAFSDTGRHVTFPFPELHQIVYDLL